MLVCFTFSELMFSERKAVVLGGHQEQALAAAESGVQMSRIFLLKDKDTQDQAGGWYDNQSVFRGIMVVGGDTPAARIRFTIASPIIDNGIPVGGIRFGLENESGKLNINNLLKMTKSKKSGSGGSNTGGGHKHRRRPKYRRRYKHRRRFQCRRRFKHRRRPKHRRRFKRRRRPKHRRRFQCRRRSKRRGSIVCRRHGCRREFRRYPQRSAWNLDELAGHDR